MYNSRFIFFDALKDKGARHKFVARSDQESWRAVSRQGTSHQELKLQTMEFKTCLITTPSDGNSSSSLGAGMLVAGQWLSKELQVANPATLHRDKAS